MWTVTADDLRVARTRASERRRAIEEEIKALDAELAELDAIEQSIRAFMGKYRPDSLGDTVTSDHDRNASSGDPAQATHLTVAANPQLVIQPKPQINANNWGNLHFKPASGI